MCMRNSSMMALIRQTLGFSSPATAKVAKDRLSIMLVHQRNSEAIASIDMLELQKEVAAVVQKYIKVAENKPANFSGECQCTYRNPHVLNVNSIYVLCSAVKQEGEFDFLEMHFPLAADVSIRK
jgi:septum formation topological specificity factor MinE